MNSQDRELLHALNFRQTRLEAAMAELKADLLGLNARLATLDDIPPARAGAPVPPAVPPQELPPLPVLAAPSASAPAQVPEPIPAPEPEGPALEIQFGRWLARIGIVFALLTVIFFSVLAYDEYRQYIGPWAKLGFLTLVSSGLIAAGLWLERSLTVYGRTLAAGGLACLYYTLYGATYVAPLQVISSPLLGGLLLLAWSGAVVVMAERRKSELLSAFAISLAYFSSAITPVGGFTMAADLILAVTAVAFLIRNGWTGLSYLCLIGTYLGSVRQIVISGPDVTGDINFVHDPASFWPWTIYLTGAWIIFTAAIFLTRGPGFSGGKRMAFLSLNNGAWAGLLLVAAELSGYHHFGHLLLLTGGLLLAACVLARSRLADARDVAAAYLAQGLALATGGVIVLYHGVTRGLILTGESVFLVAAGAYSRNVVLRLGGAVTALAGTLFLIGETFHPGPFPWWLTAVGIIAMSVNAALEKLVPGVISPASRRLSISSAFYVALAVILSLRWIYGVIPDNEITLALFVEATTLLAIGLAFRSGFLVRTALIIDLAGFVSYLLSYQDTSIAHSGPPLDIAGLPGFGVEGAIWENAFTWLNAWAFALFLAQPVLLRRAGRELISEAESWLAVLVSSAAAWLFVSNSILAAHSANLTLGWALLALALIVLGFAAGERRQRWCGLGILVAAFVRVAVHDFWGFSDGGKVLTFFALTVICLGLSFLYYKFADRLKEWL